MKYPEFILAIQNRSLRELLWANNEPLGVGVRTLQQGFNTVDLDTFLRSVQGGLIVGQRENLDESTNWGESHKGNRDYRQWLNYVVIQNHDDTINPYMRARVGAATGETDLHGRGSIAPGGHTDAVSIVFHDSVLDPMATLINNIVAELCEECAFFIDGERIATHRYEDVNGVWERRELIATAATLKHFGQLYFEGVMFDNSDPVGRLHLAVSWRFKLYSNVHIEKNEDGVDFIPAVPVNELYTAYPGVTFENWSKIFAEHLLLNPVPNGHDELAAWVSGRTGV